MCDIEPQLWSEELCLEYALKYLINPRIKNAEVQRNVMCRFIDFYCFGTIPSGFTPKKIILESVYLLTDDDERDQLYWRRKFYKEECEEREEMGEVAIALESADTINVRRINIEDFIAKYTAMLEAEIGDNGDAAKISNTFESTGDFFNYYSNSDNRRREMFSERTFDILGSVTSHPSFYTLKRLVCFLAMTFLTSLVKDDKMLANAFMSYDYKYMQQKKFFNFFSSCSYLRPMIPCKLAIENASKIKDEEFKSALAKIVLEFNRAKKTNSELCSYLTHSVMCFF